MKVIIRRDSTVKEIEGSYTVEKVLKMLNILPETVLVIKDGRLITLDTKIEDDEEIEVIPVVSGG
ncbi:MAG TPA: thiamine biosynthesis protein ThiS [Peptococcaceae bacterium]|nr:MAG: ThiamineS protein [Clostridia bacterium 41_269]HBT20838.1 thiamine biosynthesis protein ThiS [Peptococcaceae bacterium]